MSFDNLMAPIMYQDIASSFAMQPIPMMAPGFYGGMTPGLMYPGYGTGTLKPALSEDKFEKLEKRDQKDKNLLKTVAKVIGYTALAFLGIKLGRKYIPKVFQWMKGLFTKSTP